MSSPSGDNLDSSLTGAAAQTVQEAALPPDWGEDEWEHLMASIRAGLVVPVIGQDLLQFRLPFDLWPEVPEELRNRLPPELASKLAATWPKAGSLIKVENYLAHKLAEWLVTSLERGADSAERRVYAQTLLDLEGDARPHDVICAYLSRGGKREKLDMCYSKVDSLIERARFALEPAPNSKDLPFPEPLLQLAEIKQLRLYVTATFDRLLEHAIWRKRKLGSVKMVPSIAFSPNDRRDLDRRLEEIDVPTVYHLCGTHQAAEGSFALTEGDLMDFVVALMQAQNEEAKNLFEALRERHLLFLGSGYPDWLARFFLRTTKQTLFKRDRKWRDYVAERASVGHSQLKHFLSNFSEKTMFFPTGDAAAFVQELWRRWKIDNEGSEEETPFSPPPREMPKGAVFISYSMENLDAAIEVSRRLQSLGVKTWFDKEQLLAGHNWSAQIASNIANCTLFMPLVSSSTERRTKAYFRVEWANAETELLKRHGSKRPFLMPVNVDYVWKSENYGEIPDSFRATQMEQAPGGEVSDDFCQRVKAMIDELNGP